MGWCLWQRFALQHVIPTDFCYNSHRSIPLCEGLTLGLVTQAAKHVSQALAISAHCAISLGYASYLPVSGASTHSGSLAFTALRLAAALAFTSPCGI
jgi:hypothetical protein